MAQIFTDCGFDAVTIANNHMWRRKMYESTRPTDEAWGKPRDMQRLPRPHGNGYWTMDNRGVVTSGNICDGVSN